jgi:excisionase family DNA binding protein
MTTQEAAQMLGLKQKTVTVFCKRGTIKATKRGRDYDISLAEVRRYQQERLPAHRPAQRPGAPAPADPVDSRG